MTTTISKTKIYQTENGRIYWSRNAKAWYFVYEGTFLTSLANTGHRSDRTALEAAHPQTLMTPAQVAQEVAK